MLYEQQVAADTTKDDDLMLYEQEVAADTPKDTVTHIYIVTESDMPVD